MSSQASLPGELREELRAALQGVVIEPGDAGFRQARKVWNAMYDDLTPAAILRCCDEQDVARALRIVGQSELPVAVRGGGHHIAGFGTCDGGVVVDLGGIRAARLYAGGARVAVGGGATLHEVDVATDPVDRAVPLGVVSETGVGGLTLSGGIGWLTRLHGYSCDNLVAARVVTADGQIVTASDAENSDLLWGLRGGGGNFGVVTEFVYETHPVAGVVVGEAYHLVDDGESIERLLRFYRDWTAELSRPVTVWGVIEKVGPGYDLLPGSTGRLAVSFLACHVGSPEQGRRELEPLLAAGRPDATRLTPMRMVELQHLQDGSGAAAKGMRSYMKGEMITELSDAMIGAIAARCLELPTDSSLFEIGMLGGAMADADRPDSAVGLRAARYIAGFSMMAGPEDAVERGIEWARAGWSPLVERSAGGTYLNFSGDESESRVLDSLAAADRAKQRRLGELKRRFDPRNVLRINHNITPAAKPGALT